MPKVRKINNPVTETITALADARPAKGSAPKLATTQESTSRKSEGAAKAPNAGTASEITSFLIFAFVTAATLEAIYENIFFTHRPKFTFCLFSTKNLLEIITNFHKSSTAHFYNGPINTGLSHTYSQVHPQGTLIKP